MKTHYNKGPEGWRGQTDIPLANNIVLRVLTCKTPAGLATTMVAYRTDATCRLEHNTLNDYSEVFWTSQPLAITELAVRRQHEYALGDVVYVKQRIFNHYAMEAMT